MSWIDDGPLTWKASLNKSQRPRQRQSLYSLRSRFPRIISLPCAGRLKAIIIPYLLTLLVIHFMLSKFSVKNQILIFFPSLCFRNRLYRRGRADRETLAKYNQNWACRKIFPILWKMCTTITQSFVRDLSSRFP